MPKYWLTPGGKQSKECCHTEPDCQKLKAHGKQSISERYINSKASLTECKYCSDEHVPTKNNNRAKYNALRNADPDDVSAD